MKEDKNSTLLLVKELLDKRSLSDSDSNEVFEYARNLCLKGDLIINQLQQLELNGFSIDLCKLWNSFKLNERPKKEQPLLKALGLLKNSKSCVIDLTCGLAKDALLLRSYGYQVISFERNPNMYLLLISAMDKLEQKYQISWDLLYGCGAVWALQQDFSFDKTDYVFYYDPMYTTQAQQRKSAPKKGIVFLENTVGLDDDKLEIFKKILSMDKKLVVKHSSNDKFFLNYKSPIHTFGEKSTNYSLY